MAWDSYLHSLVYLVEALVMFILGKYVFQWLHRRINLETELVERGQSRRGHRHGRLPDRVDPRAGGGALGNVGFPVERDRGHGRLRRPRHCSPEPRGWLNDWLILTRSDADREIVEDQNCGVGMVSAANHVATGLILNGVLSGEGGGLIALLLFWVLGQLALVVAAKVYDRLMPYDVQTALEKDNVAVGTAYAGVLLAIGNIVRFAVAGDFVSWTKSLAGFAISVLLGLVLLPLVRVAADKLILPGGRLTQELVSQENPNVGAGVIEAVCYLSMSFLVGWSLH